MIETIKPAQDIVLHGSFSYFSEKKFSSRVELAKFLARFEYYARNLYDSNKAAYAAFLKSSRWSMYCGFGHFTSYWVTIDGDAVPVHKYIQDANEIRNTYTLVQRHTGRKRRGKFKNYYKTPGTFAEKRLNQEIDDEEPSARSARRGRNLPTAWEDNVRADVRIVSWKKFRKTQWR